MVQEEGVSDDSSRLRGQGSDDVGGEARIRGAFWESLRAVAGVICDGGDRRLGVAIVNEIRRVEWVRSVGLETDLGMMVEFGEL